MSDQIIMRTRLPLCDVSMALARLSTVELFSHYLKWDEVWTDMM